MTNPLNILVLRGGESSEREISLRSGSAVATACRNLGYVVHEDDISANNLSALNRDVDVVFPAMHGHFGEDGTLQRILEDRQIAFAGSDSRASALGMNKASSKAAWAFEGLPTARWHVAISPRDLPAFAPPYVLKPLTQGSSIGVSFARSCEEAEASLSVLLKTWSEVLIEPQLQGRELTVGILGGEPLPPIEVTPATGFYSYDAKYLANDTRYAFEIDIDGSRLREAQDLALNAFLALGARDMGRVDLILDNSCGMMLLELNTIPGFTEKSLLPMAARRAGYSMEQLVEKIILLALSRKPCP